MEEGFGFGAVFVDVELEEEGIGFWSLGEDFGDREGGCGRDLRTLKHDSRWNLFLD